MPVHILASTASSVIPTEYWATIAAACVATSFLKTWSKGVKLLDPPSSSPSPSSSSSSTPTSVTTPFTDLHGHLILIASGAFTPLGVVTLSALAHRGAQIIALTPDISSPDVVQLIHLVRDSTRSELVYAEQCDLGDLESISAFAALWNTGDKTKQEGVRRLDALLFLPPSRAELESVQVGGARRRRKDQVYALHVLARFHLVNSLLSGLLVQPPDREVRIVSVVSPFYAAGLTHFDVLSSAPAPVENKTSASQQLQSLSESSYSALVGAASLRWHALTVELQRRLDLLAEADPRPKTKLPGIDITPTPSGPKTSTSKIQQEAQKRMRQHSNISIINVCTGFERSSDVVETFLPAPSSSSILAPVRALLRWILLLCLWPFIWLLSKSPATAADSVVWATTRKLEPISARLERVLAEITQGETDVRRWQDPLVPGEMYREGRIVRPKLPERFEKDNEAWSELWKLEEAQVEKRLKDKGAQIKRPKV